MSSQSQLQSTPVAATHATLNASIYSPVILQDHEALAVKGPGGHTISKHVNKDNAYLLGRFPRLRVVSTFENLNVAELASTQWFTAYLQEFTGWFNDPNRTDVRFAKEIDISQNVGIYILRSDPINSFPTNKINLVMKVEPYNGMPHFILTAFPIEG